MPAPQQARRDKREPRYSRFSQQELPHWEGRPTRAQAAAILFVVGLVLVPLGVACLFASASVVQVRARYDDACAPGTTTLQREEALLAASAPPLPLSSGDGDGGLRCVVSLPPLPREAKAPVYLAYELTGFHQNHRRYVRSRSEAQLRGDAGTPSSPVDTSVCAPRETATENNATSVVVPCGLVAWSNFNDTFSVEASTASGDGGNETSVPLALDASPLRSPADLRGRFSRDVFPTPSFEGDAATRGGGSLAANVSLADAAALQVWMRPAALPSFRKPAGVVVVEREGASTLVPSSLPAGTVVRVTVANRFNSYRYGGTKHVVLTTRSWLGGKNPFLGWAGVGVGAGCVASAAGLALVAVFEAKRERTE